MIQEDASLSKDVKMIAVAIGNDKKQIEGFKKAVKAAYPIFLDDTLAIAAAMEVSETPTIVIVSNSGKLLSSHGGAITDIDAYLKELRAVLKAQP